MNIITNRPIDTVNIDSGDDFYSMEGDYSYAKGDRKEKTPKDKTPKDKTPRVKKTEEEKQAIKDTRKTTRLTNRQKREKDKVAKRLTKANAKLSPNAVPLTAETLPSGLTVFKQNVKSLFKKKTKTPSGEVGETKKPNSETAPSGGQSGSTPTPTTTPTTNETFYKKDEKGNDVPVPNEDVTMKNGQPFDKKDVEQAIGDGAELLNTASGLVAQYTPDDVIAVDDDVTDKTEYYKKSDIEGNWWTKQSTTVKVAIVGGSLALVGFLGYMIFKSKK